MRLDVHRHKWCFILQCRGPAMDIESRPSRKRVADVQTEDLDGRWMQIEVQRHSHKRRESLLMEECSLAIGNTTSLKRTNSTWKTKLPEMNTCASTKVWTFTTVNEQGVQWDFTNVEMRNQAFKKIVAEKTILAHRSASVCQLEIEIERELESHDAERER